MMQRFLYWLRDLLPGKTDRSADLTQTGVRVRPPGERPTGTRRTPADGVAEPSPQADLRFDAELGGRIEDAGPGKNVLVRSKYLREDTGTHDALKIIDENALEEEDDAGFDPYNTGQFDRSKNWNSRFTK